MNRTVIFLFTNMSLPDVKMFLSVYQSPGQGLLLDASLQLRDVNVKLLIRRKV